MKKRIKFCMPIGLFIYAIYQITDHIIPVPDVIAMSAMCISVAFMLIGIFYTGWCVGKHKNPYDFSGDKNK